MSPPPPCLASLSLSPLTSPWPRRQEADRLEAPEDEGGAERRPQRQMAGAGATVRRQTRGSGGRPDSPAAAAAAATDALGGSIGGYGRRAVGVL